MKVRNSLRSLKSRHRDCQVVRRKGRIYVINKTNPRFKARQGREIGRSVDPKAPANAGVFHFRHHGSRLDLFAHATGG